MHWIYRWTQFEYLMQPSDPETQNESYNGWISDTVCSKLSALLLTDPLFLYHTTTQVLGTTKNQKRSILPADSWNSLWILYSHWQCFFVRRREKLAASVLRRKKAFHQIIDMNQQFAEWGVDSVQKTFTVFKFHCVKMLKKESIFMVFPSIFSTWELVFWVSIKFRKYFPRKEPSDCIRVLSLSLVTRNSRYH